ncbi:unnamed protein product [Xylocopa violacea]|uniref:Peroxidase n=1 Tax=Xylocopa violacea TaxID=135666 RepID=A0ABP1NC82_XYLVO
MKRRTNQWIAITFVVAFLIKDATIVNSRNITSEDEESSKSARNKENLSDLEGSETSYRFGHVYQPFSSLPLHTAVSTFFPSGVNKWMFGGQSESCVNAPRGCQKSRYRTYDGSCNNQLNPTWGMSNTRYGRLLSSNYGDGIRSPTVSITGENLPSARLLSYTLFPDVNIKDPKWTLAAMQWGQIMAHDMGLVAGSTQSKPHMTQCCTRDGQLIDPLLLDSQCYPIIVPIDDPVFSKSNIRCFNFVRGTTDIDRGCSSGYKPAEQLTSVTHFLDLSVVYGSTNEMAAILRAGVGGRLRVDVRYNREWPPSPTNKSSVCENRFQTEVCYVAGDTRVNQNTQLTVLQIILLREHNRIADTLARLNPHWTDETIFQETRRILIAEHQHISYYEWMPIFLGMEATYGNQILYDTKNYVNDYNPRVNPSTLNEHSNGAFRYFHTLVAGYLNLVTENRYSSSALRLSDYFNRPGVIEEGTNMDDLARGLSYQPQEASDEYFDEEITQYLFRNGQPLGSDLHATDIQRNRDHGLASYNMYREYCGLPRAKSFEEFTDYIAPSNVEKLAQLYASPDDVDLHVGGSLERSVPGTLTGPTFLCIFVRQFYRTRVGDRYWFETDDSELAFTIEQLNEIRKSSIARLLCDNGDQIRRMQLRGFQQVSATNPIMDCDDIPSIDLSLWRDYALEVNHRNSPYPHFK